MMDRKKLWLDFSCAFRAKHDVPVSKIQTVKHYSVHLQVKLKLFQNVILLNEFTYIRFLCYVGMKSCNMQTVFLYLDIFTLVNEG